MSLAQDIIRKVAGDLTPRGERKKKKPNSDYMELTKRLKIRSTGYPNVMKDITHGTFRVAITYNRERYYLGSFTKPERADIAARLFKYWIGKGFTNIPTGKEMRHVYFDPDR